MSAYQRAEQPAQPGRAARPYLMVPVDLVVAYKDRPAVVGIYACIARLNSIYKSAVDVSRSDLARWCDTDPKKLAGCIKRAIDDLHADGWLIKDRCSGGLGKLHLLAAWGNGLDAKPRLLRFDRHDRGRPKGMRYVELPLDLFDLYLGRLTPCGDDAATVDRYFARPLLSFADLGSYAVRLLASLPATPRLELLGLDKATAESQIQTIPTLDELLEQAAAGQLRTCDDAGAPVVVALAPAGAAHLRRLAARPPSSSHAQDGSPTDPQNKRTGSPGGSVVSSSHYAPECAEADVIHSSGAAWDVDGMNQSIKRDPSSKESQRAHEQQARAANSQARHNDQEDSVSTRAEHPPEPEQLAGASENNHILALDPMIAEWHQALNPGREISDAELFALLDLQQRHGVDALRRWLFRATNAGKTFVLPSYYEACAAADAFAMLGQSRGSQRPIAVDMTPELPPAEKPQTPRDRPQRPVAQPRPLDADRANLVAEIEQRAGCAIRRPEKLAGVPLDLLARWRDIAGHPGLLARWDMGWLVSEAAKNHEPPTMDELNRWAEEKGIHWADPRLAAFRTDRQDTLQVAAPGAEDETDTCGECHNVAPELQQGKSSISEGLWHDILRSIRGQTDLQSFNTWLRPARLLSLTDSHATVGVPNAANKDALERRFTAPIRELLRERIGRTVHVRIVIAPAAPQYQPRPEWIDKATWQQLDTELRAALTGSSLAPDGGLDVRADAYELLCTHYAAPVRALLELAQARTVST